MNQARTALFLISENFIADYLYSGIIDKLSQEFKLSLFIKKNVDVDLSRVPVGVNIQFVCVNDESDISYMKVMKIFAWRNRHKSSTFKWRFNREYRKLFNLFFDYKRITNRRSQETVMTASYRSSSQDLKFIKKLRRLLLYFVRAKRRRIYIKVIGSKLLFPFMKNKLIKRLPANNDLYEKLKNTNCEIILFPNIAFGSLSIEVAKIGRELGIKTLYLIDNWDNLSSKSILWELPDYACTWGPQSNEHAIKIHGFRKEQLFNIGTPRYEGYRGFQNERIASKVSKNRDYILFLDTIARFDTQEVLEMMSDEISKMSELMPSAKIIYRPHPKSDWMHRIDWRKLPPNVELDHETKIRLQEPGVCKHEDITNYLVKLISGSLFVLGGATSMIIEAALMDKFYILLAHKEPFNIESPRKAYVSYEHLKGIELLQNVLVAKSRGALIRIFRNLLLSGAYEQEIVTNREELEKIYKFGDSSFAEELLATISKVLKVNQPKQGTA